MSIPVTMETELSFLPMARLKELGPSLKRSYETARPYPHVVIDDIFDPILLARVVSEFPGPDRVDWKRFDSRNEVKLASNRDETFGPSSRLLLYQLNSAPFLDFLTELTGIRGLIADSYFEGGGMHQIERGGKLGVHADFNKHRATGLDRRLNVILYLNQDWSDDYGGHFEMWDESMRACVKKVSPIFNRMVVFATTDTSFHGHPDPLNCPAGMTRKSLALYYYTNGRPATEVSPEHTTLFKARPGEAFRMDVEAAKALARDLLPPVLTRALAGLKQK